MFQKISIVPSARISQISDATSESASIPPCFSTSANHGMQRVSRRVDELLAPVKLFDCRRSRRHCSKLTALPSRSAAPWIAGCRLQRRVCSACPRLPDTIARHGRNHEGNNTLVCQCKVQSTTWISKQLIHSHTSFCSTYTCVVMGYSIGCSREDEC